MAKHMKIHTLTLNLDSQEQLRWISVLASLKQPILGFNILQHKLTVYPSSGQPRRPALTP